MKIDKAIIGIIIFLVIYIMLLFNPSKDTVGLTIMMTAVILIVLTPIIIIIINDRKRKKEFLKEFEEMKENSERYTVLKVTKTKKRINPKGIKITIQGFAVLLIILIFQIKQMFNLNKENITEFIILLIPTAILALLLYSCIKKMKQENITAYTYPKYTFYGTPYETVLTPKELEFYNMLKPITDKYNLLIFSKVRLADIIKTRNKIDFKKVCSKHIDFVITDKDTSPIAYIELDDVSHTYEETIIRDEKKNIIFESAGLHLIRVKTTEMERQLPFIESILINKKKDI